MRLTEYWVGGRALKEMNATHLMEREVVAFKETEPCHEIAEVLVRKNFGSVPIVDGERHLVGIVSEFDLLQALLKGYDLKKMSAGEAMTRPAISVSDETSAEEIIGLLQARHLIRVPVVDSKGKLIGIVARRDLLAGYIESTLGPLPAF